MSVSIRQALADAAYNRDQHRYPSASDIKTAEFRRGLGEIDVQIYDEAEWAEAGDTYTVTVPTEDVLTAILQKMIEEES